MTNHSSACPLDCPDACSLDVTVEDGKVTRVAAGEGNPLTAGFICSKVAHFADHAHGPERITAPLARVGPKGEGTFREISWDEALDTVAGRLLAIRERHGGEGLLPLHYGGSNGVLTEGLLDERFFRRYGASRLAKTVCAAASGAAAKGLYGRMAGVPFGDYTAAKLIVVWGCNPSASSIHLVPFIKAAQRNGARLVVIDPRRTPLARAADLHLALRPGTDLVVALAVIHWLVEGGHHDADFLEAHTTGLDDLRRAASAWTPEEAAREADVPLDDLLDFAKLYAESSPAVIRCGWGPERNRNGGSATAAVLALPAVAGKFGVRGGGFTMSNSGVWDYGTEAAVAAAPTATRVINMNHVGRQLLDPDGGVHGVFVYNCNPLATLPRQDMVRRGLERDDLFTVVHEQVMTDTCRYADVVLPATTFLEHEELAHGYGAVVLQRSAPVLPPVGESRSNLRLFAELLERTGLSEPGDVVDPDALSRTLISDLPGDVTETLEREGATAHAVGASYVQMKDVLPGTPDGRIHLFPKALDEEAPGGLYHYLPDPRSAEAPLTLISPALGRTISSTFGQLIKGTVPVRLHPDDARARGLNDGDEVVIENAFGRVTTKLKIDDDLRPGVAVLPKGIWDRHTKGGTSNTLSPDTLTDLGGGACFNDARVQVSRA